MNSHKQYTVDDVLQYVLNGESDFEISDDDSDVEFEPDNAPVEPDVETHNSDQENNVSSDDEILSNLAATKSSNTHEYHYGQKMI